MSEVDLDLITKRSIRGIVALTSRTFIIQVIAFISNFLLTVFLTPAIFGVYFVVSAAIAFLQYFSDIGLAAALIQKKEEITKDDLKTTFTIQQGLVVTVTVLAIIGSGWVGKFYDFGQDGVFLFQALAIAFFLSSLKTIPSILLERELKFEKLVIPQIVETLVFNILVVYLALNGFGIASFTYSVLARGVSGLIAMYIISPWRIQFGYSRQSASKLLSFGLPFQLNSFLALVKDDLFIAYLGKVLPIAQVGYIGFAQKWAFVPLRLVMDNVIRITFPSFSRLQDDSTVLQKAIEKSVFAASFLILPSLAGLAVLAPYFVDIIPKYSKWEPAILSLCLFAFSAALSSISTPLTNALNAIGKIKTTLYLMVFWTIATWVLTPILISIYGFNGVALASAIIACSLVIVIFLVKKHISFNLIQSTYAPLTSALVMGICLYLLGPLFIKGIYSLLFMILIGAVIYFLTILLIARKQIILDARFIMSHLKK